MEVLCQKEYEQYLIDNSRLVIARWHTSRTHFGANDFMGWDLAWLTTTDDYYRDLHLIQVKPSFSEVEYRKLKLLRFGTCHLAVYGTRPRNFKFKTQHFYFIEI